MRLKIDGAGNLWIERAGKWKGQLCPHDTNAVQCGDHCPMFDEPMREEDYSALDICGHYRLEGEIIDERIRQ
jgi:hypothetical protein